MKKTKLVTMLGAISLIGAIGAGSTFAYLTSTQELSPTPLPSAM